METVRLAQKDLKDDGQLLRRVGGLFSKLEPHLKGFELVTEECVELDLLFR